MLKIAHIALSVSDIDKSFTFYRKNFGFKCTEKFKVKSAGLKVHILKKDKAILELFEFQNYNALPEYRKNLDNDLKTLGTKHFALGVADIEKVYHKLKKSKVEFVTDMRIFENGLKYFFIKDPDGILLEIIEQKQRHFPS